MAKVTFSPTDLVEVNRITLEKLKQAASISLGATTLDSMNLRIEEIPGLYGMVATISTDLLASRIANDTYTAHFNYKVPETWFQHWKEAKAPEWFKRRYPVRYERKEMMKTITFKRYETYPKANVAIPKDRRTIEMLGYERPLLDIVEEL